MNHAMRTLSLLLTDCTGIHQIVWTLSRWCGAEDFFVVGQTNQFEQTTNWLAKLDSISNDNIWWLHGQIGSSDQDQGISIANTLDLTRGTGSCRNIKMPSYQYGNPHDKDMRCFHDGVIFIIGIPILAKTVFILYVNRTLQFCTKPLKQKTKSHIIFTQYCSTFFCCCYIIINNRLMRFIYPYPSGLLHWYRPNSWDVLNVVLPQCSRFLAYWHGSQCRLHTTHTGFWPQVRGKHMGNTTDPPW